MSRIAWGAYGGDDVETVVAIMIQRDHPTAQRVRPGQGDGGIDIYVRAGPKEWEVYQVKKFADALTASHKGQITKSWKRMLKHTKDKGITVTAWHVVRPIDPTPNDRKWLEELTAGSGIPSDWVGLTAIDSWTAKYPDVIDFYLRDSKDAVLAQGKSLLAADSLLNNDGLPTEGVIAALENLGRLQNAADPHYRYDLSVRQDASPTRLDPRPGGPGLMYSSLQAAGDQVVQIDVYERYLGASSDRPLTMTAEVIVADDDGVRERWQDFIDYGSPVENIPVRIVDGNLPGMDATDGIDADFSAGNLSAFGLLPVEFVLRREGHEVARLPVSMHPPTRGVDGSRMEWRGSDPTGLLDISVRTGQHGGLLNLRSERPFGYAPAGAARVLRAQSEMRAGTTAEFWEPDGPLLTKLGVLTDDLVPYPGMDKMLAVCEALAIIQKHVPDRLVLPDPASITDQIATEWLAAATVLSGKTARAAWGGLRHADFPASVPLPVKVRMARPLSVTVGEQTYQLGYTTATFTGHRWEVDAETGQTMLLPRGEVGDVKVRLTKDPADVARADNGEVEFERAPAPKRRRKKKAV